MHSFSGLRKNWPAVILLSCFLGSLCAAFASEKPVKYFGVISRYNPRIMYQNYQPIMEYLTRHTPYHFELKLGKTYENAVTYLRDEITDIASFGAVTYLEAHKAFGAIPILRPLNQTGEPFYRSIIITRADSDLRTLADAKGRSFAFASILSTSGNLIPRLQLAEAGIHLKDLERYANFKHHDSVAKAVLTGVYDAGAVKDVIAYKYEDKGLRFLHLSGPIPSVPIAVRPDTSPAFITAVQEALLRLNPVNPQDSELMQAWDPEFRFGFTKAEDADYDRIRQKLNAIPTGCGKGCHPHILF
jgi:phosphonate transport system substrate-binding protein